MAKTEPTSGKDPARSGMDPIILVVIAAIAVIAIAAFIMVSSSSPPEPEVSGQQCGEQTLTFVNRLLASQGTTATLVSVEEDDGMYLVTVARKGEQIPLYATEDCTLVFSDPMEMGAAQRLTSAGCGERALAYVNENLVAEGTNATLMSVGEVHGMKQVTVAYNELEIPLYATAECSLLFMEGMDMTAPAPTPTPTPEPVKTGRPTVDLYVMSFCPYGTQAEATMKPVVDLLGEKADIHLRYITTVTGTNVTSVRSLHGAVEAEEDLRQACIQNYSPAGIWAYLTRFNAECYPLIRNTSVMLRCSQNITASLGVEGEKIKVCATGTEGIGLLKTDEEAAAGNDATASPTLLINGVPYSGPRTPEGYKQAICASFTTPPAECGTVLSGEQAAIAGSC